MVDLDDILSCPVFFLYPLGDGETKETKPYEKTGQFLLTAWLYQFVRGGAGELRYEASGSAHEGYLIVFDTKTPVGEDCEPRYHEAGDKRITSFTIAVGKND